MKRTLILVTLLFSLSAMAENAITLPQGKFRARVKPIYASKITRQYNSERNEASLVQQFERTLDVNLASSLNPQLGAAMGMMGISSLGDFKPSLELTSLVFGSALEYGFTDNLTLGVIVPVIKAKSKFDLKFERSPAGQHPAFANLNFVKSANEVAVSKGYKPLGNWNKTGLGDVEIGLKYRFLNTDTWSIATKAGVRLPTGRVDDPDHLTDVGFGDGQTDVGATLLVDYHGLPNLLVNLMTKLTVQLPDREELRVPSPGDLFTANKENLQRDLGDRFDAALYAEYTFLKNFNLHASSKYFTKRDDSYWSDQNTNTDRLEKNTSQMKVTADMGLGFSTIPWVREGSFPLPMDMGINLELPIVGKNVAKATTVNLEYKLYF